MASFRTLRHAIAEIRGCRHSMFVGEAERMGEAYRAFSQSLREGQFQRAEFKRLGKGGREVHIQAAYNPVAGRGGRIVKVVKIATDVTAETLRAIDVAEQVAALHRSQAIAHAMSCVDDSTQHVKAASATLA